MKKSGPLRLCPTQLKNIRCSLCSHFPPWRKSLAEGISFGTEICGLGGGVMWVKWNCFSYASTFRFFSPSGLLELLRWTPRCPQRYSLLWVVIKISVSVGRVRVRARNSCSTSLCYHSPNLENFISISSNSLSTSLSFFYFGYPDDTNVWSLVIVLQAHEGLHFFFFNLLFLHCSELLSLSS